jgi:nucleoid DNA-binding protein
MNKSDLVERVSEVTSVKRSDVSVVADALFDAVLAGIAEHGQVKISGFGTFFVHQKNARIARNPKTGEKVEVPAKRVPKFKASRAMKEML